MFELLIFIVGLFIGYHVGYSVLIWRIKDLIIKEAKNEGMDVSMFEEEEKPTNTVSQLFVERSNNVLYLYDKEANSFICQASTLEDLARLAKEYKNIKYAAVMDEQADIVVAFVDGRVEANLLGKPHES
jgi:hypothetical protein